jgi:hypothetical protein
MLNPATEFRPSGRLPLLTVTETIGATMGMCMS